MIENIIFVSDYGYTEGGASQVAISMALSMSRLTNKNVFFISGTEKVCDELLKSNIKIFQLNEIDLLAEKNRVKAFIRGIYKKRVEKNIYKILDEFDPNNTIIHVHTYTKVLTSACFKAAYKRNIPLGITIHDYFLACPNGGFYNYKNKNICHLMPCSYKCIKCNCDSRHYYHKIFRLCRQFVQNHVINSCSNISLIYLSQFSKDKLDPNLKFKKRSYIMNNPIIFSDRERYRAESNHIFLYIGRVTYEKGTDTFCKAVRKMHVRGVVVGDGNQKDILEKEFTDIEFKGWQNKNQIRDILKETRCLIFPSPILEVSPLTVPEVQAYGIPCVVTNCCAAVDFVKDGYNGCVVAPNVDGICQGIQRMKDDQMIKIYSENTFASFNESDFTDSGVIATALKIYEDIVSNRTRV